jgi:hypothetical protein
MRTNSCENDGRDAPSRSAANGERSRVRAEREAAERPGYPPGIKRDVTVPGHCSSDGPQCACIEEGDVAVGAADGERAAVVTERLVENAVAPFADDADRVRVPEQRGKEVAAGRL